MRTFIIILLSTLMSFSAFAQQHREQGHKHTRDEMSAEQVAFITNELELTAQEAEQFWPIYNKSWDERREARRNTMQSLNKLNKFLESQKDGVEKSEKEIEKLVESYLGTLEKESQLVRETYEKVKEILPVEKAAKILYAEEKFRSHLIRQLRKRSDNEK